MEDRQRIKQLEGDLEALKNEYDHLVGDFKTCLEDKTQLANAVDAIALQLVTLKAALEMASGTSGTLLRLALRHATPDVTSSAVPSAVPSAETAKSNGKTSVRSGVDADEALGMLNDIAKRKSSRIQLGPGKDIGDENDS